MVFGLIAAVIAVAVGGLSYKAARDAQKQAKKAAEAMAGVLVNKESNIQAVPVIYGTRRVGGTRVFVHTQGGDKNEYLYIALVLCEGEVNSISDIELDNKPITDSRFSGLYSYQVFTGTDSQSASSLLSATSKWGSTHKLSGIAYIAIRLKWDQDAFSGIPDITALVEGKKVYDPRTATTGFSNNPALCIRDYLTNSRYGKGLSSGEINDTAFSQAANDIESFTVTEYSGGPAGVQLFKCNAVIDTDDPIFQNLEKMLIGCKGFLPYQDGKYSLYIDQSSSSVMTLNESKIVGGISIQSERKEDKFNRVICKFPNPETDYQPDQAIWPDPGSSEETTFLSEDDGEVLVDEVDLDTITSFYAARDFARIFCLRSRNALRTALTATSEALNLRVGDVVSITHSTPGWTAKPFQVESLSLRYDGTVDLQCVEYDSTIYAYDSASEEHTYDDTELPDPFDVAAPTNLSVTETTTLADDGAVLPALKATWTAADDAFVDLYDVVLENTTDSTSQAYQTNDTQYVLTPVIVGKSYLVKVRSVNSLGIRSAFITQSYSPNGDTTAPGIPTSLSANGGYKAITVSWANPTDTDLRHVQLQVSTNGFSWSNLAVVSGESFVHYVNAFNSTRYYRARSVDFSGNASSYTSSVFATTEFVDNDAFEDGIVEFFESQGAYPIQNGSSLPSGYTSSDAGKLFFLTTNGKLYRWTGSAWTVAVVDLGDQAGQITETQVTDDAITAPKLAANSVVTASMAAGTIDADRILANSITGGLIAASGIITQVAQIGDGLIENAKIANGAITTAKIGNAEVESLKIKGSAVTIPEGATTAATTTALVPTVWTSGASVTVYWDTGTNDVVPEAWIANAYFNLPDNNSSSSIRRSCHIRILIEGTFTYGGSWSLTGRGLAEIAPEERYPAVLISSTEYPTGVSVASGITFTVQAMIEHPDGTGATGSERHKLKGSTGITVLGTKR